MPMQWEGDFQAMLGQVMMCNLYASAIEQRLLQAIAAMVEVRYGRFVSVSEMNSEEPFFN